MSFLGGRLTILVGGLLSVLGCTPQLSPRVARVFEGARLGEKPPLPRLEIQVRDSDSGDAQLRGAGQLTQLLSPLTSLALIAAGGGNMVADVYIVDEGDRSQYVGHFTGGSFGAVTEVEIAAGERVGHQIARHLEH